MTRDFERMIPWLLIVIGFTLIVTVARMVDDPFNDTKQRTPTEQPTE